MNSTTVRLLLVVSACCCAPGFSARAEPVGTAFTYQGQLKRNGVPVNGYANVQFVLYDAETGGTNLGSNGFVYVPIVNGLFNLQLDFGDETFGHDARWLEVLVRFPAGSGIVTTLAPRQKITAAPYALTAKRAEDLELPFAGTVNMAGSAVALTQTGTGRVLTLNKPGGSEAVVSATHGGTGPCGEFFVNNVASGEAAVLGTSIGTGPGVHGKSGAGGAAVEGSALGSGRAASFHTEYATNDSPTVYAEQKGTGRCGHFRITNANNDLQAVAASTTGDGAALSGYTVGGGPAVHAKTDGSGYAIHADSTDDAAASGGGIVMVGREDGNNIAIDGNEIMARSDGVAAPLFINNEGGDVVFGGDVAIEGNVDIGYAIVTGWEVTPGNFFEARCRDGKKVLGGGCTCGTDLEQSFPSDDGAAWYCLCSLTTMYTGTAYAICANVEYHSQVMVHEVASPRRGTACRE